MSVRSRLEQAERQELVAKLDAVPPARTTAKEQVVTVTSVRDRADRAASLAKPDTVVKLDTHQSGVVAVHSFSERVRDRQANIGVQAARSPTSPSRSRIS